MNRSTRWWPRVAAITVALAMATWGCGRPTPSRLVASRAVRVVAAENFWASIAAQIGGAHVAATSVISNPATDPHAYEPTPGDGRDLAAADLVIVNGVGYDRWADKLLAANGGGQAVINVGAITHVPAGGNPHRWYNPTDVQTVAGAVAADLAGIDPADAGDFRAGLLRFDTALGEYHTLIASIRARYAGTAVGASESIFSMLAPALGLDLVTPGSFLRAITQGTDVSAADKSTVDNQIKSHLISVYVYNSQNATPDVAAQVKECQMAGIPTPSITETMAPPTATFQDWQSTQLRGIEAGLARATGR